MKQPPPTFREMCELGARYLFDTTGKTYTWDQIYNASQSGELWHVFDLYWKALLHFGIATHDSLPETGSHGDIAFIHEGGDTVAYMHDWNNWHEIGRNHTQDNQTCVH